MDTVQQGVCQAPAQDLPLARPPACWCALRDGKPGGAVQGRQLRHEAGSRVARPGVQHRLRAIRGVVVVHVGPVHARRQVEAEPLVQERGTVTH